MAEGEASSAAQQRGAVDWKSAAKDLAKALAKALASAVARGVVAITLSLVLNLAFSIVFLFASGLIHGGRASAIVVPLALVPFAPFVALAFVLAQKQGIARLVAAAVESQGPTLAGLGSHHLGTFLQERHGDLRQTRVGGGFDRAWSRYLKSRKESSWLVRTLIARVTLRVPLGELIDRFAQEGVPSQQIPEKVMAHVIAEVAQEKLRPGWTPWLLLFGINVVWFPIVTWGIWYFI